MISPLRDNSYSNKFNTQKRNNIIPQGSISTKQIAQLKVKNGQVISKIYDMEYLINYLIKLKMEKYFRRDMTWNM